MWVTKMDDDAKMMDTTVDQSDSKAPPVIDNLFRAPLDDSKNGSSKTASPDSNHSSPPPKS